MMQFAIRQKALTIPLTKSLIEGSQNFYLYLYSRFELEYEYFYLALKHGLSLRYEDVQVEETCNPVNFSNHPYYLANESTHKTNVFNIYL